MGKVFKSLRVEKEEQQLVDILCNKCGNSLKSQIFEGEDVYEGIPDVWVWYGYGSKNDGIKLNFSLCETCVNELVKTFKIEPEINDTTWGDRHTWEEIKKLL